MESRTIWTVGHSNHTIEHFIAMLREAPVRLVADVRRFPGSRRQVQFQQDSLQEALRAAEIGYRHFPELGGRRTTRAPDSPNRGWRVESFNAYADHMRTSEFSAALAELEELAGGLATAMMCSEAVPWRCHRRLIADALIARGWAVLDIFGPGRFREHHLTGFARVDDGEVTYPASPMPES